MRRRLLTVLAASALPLLSLDAAAAVTAKAPSALPSASSAGNLLQVLFGLIVVLALMALLAWVLRRFNASKVLGNSDIRIVGGVSVGTRERVVVVEIADQWIVVGVAPGRVNALATMTKQETSIATDAEPAKNFSNWLAKTMDKRNG
ncbi:flagellar biosynthetic protein FliO [Oxalicibacterium faecigallinarum]|uniref:Flagellar protein n=1 Tax=Oxalicibacterium faecigallinarum TaxID=573741 RepID=A0A8J3EYU5_9BURK|nr:flagellar biosynthetic protein FliO [Oxalicibacterium faecigallinarum]GGI16340.1 flagellar protein FliO [Oxalicibacterium faecigallinarum]